MPQFWFGTYPLDPVIEATGTIAEPIMSREARALAIEVIRDGQTLAVLFSAVDDPNDPHDLDCRIGFSNDPEACNSWRDNGFPLVDASIECAGDEIRVVSPYFANDADSMQYGNLLISLSGVRFAASAANTDYLQTTYAQFQQSPDRNAPATHVLRKPVRWTAPRSNVVKLSAPQQLTLTVTACRWPSLRPFSTGLLGIANAWAGELSLDVQPQESSRGLPERVNRVDTFGVPAFRFEDIEVIGFRLDLDGPDIDEALADLIDPLNFHLTQERTDHWIPDFRYRPATRTVLVELLRYGRMKLTTQDPPLTLLDFQSQHELVVRVLVGRVDDDSAQARAPAIYVPAIFVDNPWSKILGRDAQGFEKCMAEFCLDRGNAMHPVRPDGRVPGEEDPCELGCISQVNLVARSGNGVADSCKILTVDCPPERYSNWNDLEQIDLGVALGRFSLIDTRWRQTDFDRTEFRRSFAREAMREDLNGFHSIQVAPVGERGLDRAWITAKFSLDNYVRLVYPTGGAHLTFYSPAAAPAGWKNWCKILRVDQQPGRPVAFQTGSWYRMKFSMSMTVDDGLEWSDAAS